MIQLFYRSQLLAGEMPPRLFFMQVSEVIIWAERFAPLQVRRGHIMQVTVGLGLDLHVRIGYNAQCLQVDIHDGHMSVIYSLTFDGNVL